MIVDTSVWLAVLFQENDNELFSEKLKISPIVKVTAPSFLEATISSVNRLGKSGVIGLNGLFELTHAEIIPFGPEAARLAAKAFLQYGKGQGHPAQLNFGDCMVYAASKVEAMPLLFKGNDFTHTDVERAL
jgi:ribonuclease VapC